MSASFQAAFFAGSGFGLCRPVATDDVAQQRQVMRCAAIAHAAVVLAERDVQHSVQRVLYPVWPYSTGFAIGTLKA